MLSLCVLPNAKNALVVSLIFPYWKLNLQTKLWNNFLHNLDHCQFFNKKSILCPHRQLISFVLQHAGNPFSHPQPTHGFFPGACVSSFYLHTKPVHVYKHIEALVCLTYPKAMDHLDPLLALGWFSTCSLPWSWSHHCCSGLTKVWSVGHHCFPGVLEGLNFSFCLWCILWEVFHSPCAFFFLFSAFICSDVSALLVKNSNLLTISVWASLVSHLRPNGWL